MVTKRLSLLTILLFSGPVLANRGGDGPCPVPNYHSDIVVAKRCHAIASSITQIAVSPYNPRSLVYIDLNRDLKWAALEGGLCENDMGPILFKHPLSIWINQKPWPIAKKHEATKIITDQGLQGLAVEDDHLIKIDARTGRFTPICQIPKHLKDLQPMQHSPESNSAWFSQVVVGGMGGPVIHLYRLIERNCYWQPVYSLNLPKGLNTQIEVLTASRPEVENRGVAIFKEGHLYWVTARGNEHLDEFVIQHNALPNETPTLLGQNLYGKLVIYFPERGIKSTIFENVFGYRPGKAYFDGRSQRLFVASSIGGEEKSGAFEFEIRLPE